ncbi:hypothetical protein LBMAG42_24230 [Deltaproteobacteria bacterium]|nr:hypothetical protein LBMAG42_24230 [Deltaproteobacteria bacterium]
MIPAHSGLRWLVLALFVAPLVGCEVPVDADGDGYDVDHDCDDAVASIHPDAAEVCNGLDDDCDDAADEDVSTSFYRDEDGDGYGAASSEARVACDQPIGYSTTQDDCDDTSTAAYPGATEFCDDLDNDCDGEFDEQALDAPTWFTDADGDNFGDPASFEVTCVAPVGTVLDGSDCLDTDATVNPDATERCNGLDDDCDGLFDDESASDAATWFIDYDADGFGAEGYDVVACEVPAGYSATADDCDDTLPGVNPAAIETCDALDDDCDGTVDEPDAVDALPWYADTDGDGYGDAAVATPSCQRPAGFVADGTDCDDAASSTHPNAAEVCGGGDEDCDGTIDEMPATNASLWYTDADGDTFGDPASAAEACAAPAGAVADATDCDDTNAAVCPGAAETWYDGVDGDCDGASDFDADLDGYASAAALSSGTDCDDAVATVNPAASEVCDDGVDNDCDETANSCGVAGDVSLADADVRFGGEAAGDAAGWSVAGAGDVDGDGLADVLLGAPSGGTSADGAGAAYLVSGPGAGGLSVAALRLSGDAAGDSAGWAVAGPGDVTGDGTPDLFVGAPGASGAGDQAGAVYLIDGTAAGSVALSAGTTWTGEAAWDYAGSALAGTGDLDADGLADLAVGAWGGGTGDVGRVYWIAGGTGVGSLTAAAGWLDGEDLLDGAGRAVAAAGDVDGSGVGGLVVGAPGSDAGGLEAGAAYLWLGAPVGAGDLGNSDARWVGVAASDAAGTSVAGVGDEDGDGYDDVLIGAPGADDGGVGAGVAYLVRGPVSGELSLADADAWFVGEAAGAAAGTSVAGGGDVNGDGFAELLVGAPGTAGDRAYAGLAYLVNGPAIGAFDLFNADARLAGESGAAFAGHAVAGAGDADGDGDDDVLIGAYGDDGDGALAGAAYLLFSGGL